MKTHVILILAIYLLSGCIQLRKDTKQETGLTQNGPIQLHPENPHYFLYKGKAKALISSAEHYGAVLNLDFDYEKYLETLASEGMNYTRIFTGTYFEIAGESFGIQHNTLAPEKDKISTPWAIVVSDLSGQTKYDLSTWNEAYFARLKKFMSLAAEKGIIVEVTLFSSIYRDAHWDICPQNPNNNINIRHAVTRFDAQTLHNGTLFKFQEAFVRKMVTELNEYDNFFFEIQNEPWADHTLPVYNIFNKEELKENDWTFKADFADEVSMAWQDKLVSIIVDEESKLEKQHLIAQNYTNFKASIPAVNDDVSIINFHYAWPEAATWNYHYNKVLGFDESGFAGAEDMVYRKQAWRFMLSGGGLFNNLDYSLYPGSEDGLGENNAPGGGSKNLRFQLKVLSEFLHGFELEKLHPDITCIAGSPGLIPYIMSDSKGSFAIFLQATGTNKTTLKLKTVDGKYEYQILNTITGDYGEKLELESRNGIINLDIQIPEGELAIKLTRI